MDHKKSESLSSGRTVDLFVAKFIETLKSCTLLQKEKITFAINRGKFLCDFDDNMEMKWLNKMVKK